MKTLKIIAVLALVALAAALLIASAYAYTGGRIGAPVSTNSAPTGTSYTGYGGMMGGGGMMSGYYNSAPVVTAPPQSNVPPTTTPTTPSNQYPNGQVGCRCMMSRIQ